MLDIRIWPVTGTDAEFGDDEWEVVDLTPAEPNTLMISTLERCREEHPDAPVER